MSQSRVTSRFALQASALAAALLLGACNRQTGDDTKAATPASGAAPGAAAASAPPVGVTTVRAVQRDMPVLIATTGTVTPLASVEVRPQTTSVVAQVHVREGQFVRRGDLLFTLDARTDQTDLAKAQAELTKAQAGLADAERQLARSRELLAQNFIAQTAVDTNQTLAESQRALVASGRAAVEAARVALSHARITAPSAGRLGAINVFPGSSVSANTTTLASVTQLDPITVSFSLPQRHLADALAALKDGGAPVTATAPEGGGAPLAGKLRFVDNAVDPATGTVKVKAQFDNKDDRLWPGAFVNVAMTARVLAGAVVVPQVAIIQSARGTIVYVVQDGKAVPRPVEQLYAQGEDAAVSGVKPGERVVVDGRQNLRPGAPVVERAREGGRGASGAASGGGGRRNRGADGAASTAGGMAGAPETPGMVAGASNGTPPGASATPRAPAP